MANKKKKTTVKQQKQAAEQRRYIGFSMLILLGILLCFSLVTSWMGPVGGFLKPVLLGVFGSVAYAVPVYLIALAIFELVPQEAEMKRVRGVRFWLFAVALLLLSSIIHICSEQAELYASANGFFDFIGLLYGGASTGAISGGVLGGLLAYLPYIGLAKVGSLIILIFCLLLALIGSIGFLVPKIKKFLFPYSAEDIKESVEKSLPLSSAEERAERRAERREEKERKAADAFADVRETPVSSGKKSRQEKPEERSEYDIPLASREPDPGHVDEQRIIEAMGGTPEPDLITDFEKIQQEEEEEKKLAAAETKVVMKQQADALRKNIEEEPENEYANYELPPLSLLRAESKSAKNNDEELRATARKIVDTLADFNVDAKVVNISRGPSVTRYELTPGSGVRISKFTTLADDLALALKVATVRIEAPIPGKGTIGIEVANKEATGISMRRLIAGRDFREAKSKMTAALGLDISGNAILCDIASMPHLLIAGTTGSGKSVCLNTMIVSILYRARPDEVKMIMVDPKQVEFECYNGMPHMLAPVVTDPKRAAGTLKWAVGEMERRYKLFSETGARNIQSYNELAEKNGDKPLAQILIVIDEVADMMMCAPHDVEESINRIAAKARAAGMHLIVATQRPSVDVLTGTIKANIPSRIALSVANNTDSRIILDMGGAEKLLGKGDMLYLPIGRNKPLRLQGCFLSDSEIKAVTDYIKGECGESSYDQQVIEGIEKASADAKEAAAEGGDGGGDYDPMLPDAVEVVVEAGQCSTSLLQRRLKLGYSRAARIVDEMEGLGIVGPFEGSKPRRVQISQQQWQEMRMNLQNKEG